MKHLVTLMDWSPAEIRKLLSSARKSKSAQRNNRRLKPSLAGKTLALIFEKSSMRTRVSFQVAITQLGGSSIYLSKSDIDLGTREPVKDGARVLSRYVHGIVARVYHHSTVEELAAYATVPVINALSDKAHPCQALADMLTIQEHFGGLKGISVAFIGDSNNVAASLAVACAKLGVPFRIASPKAYRFDEAFTQALRSLGGPPMEVTDSPEEAARGAHVLYTDTWVSMGQESEMKKRLRDFAGYCVDSRLLALAHKKAIVMHCLPAHRGQEITDEVIEGPQSVVFDQAENRLHAQRALLEMLFGGPRA
jgi:ornithine carbamoyltransferase